MINKETLKKQIVYRATHRGSKEMDILLGNFVSKYINSFSESELDELKQLLLFEDEILYQWYFGRKNNFSIPNNKVSEKLKNFKL